MFTDPPAASVALGVSQSVSLRLKSGGDSLPCLWEPRVCLTFGLMGTRRAAVKGVGWEAGMGGAGVGGDKWCVCVCVCVCV